MKRPFNSSEYSIKAVFFFLQGYKTSKAYLLLDSPKDLRNLWNVAWDRNIKCIVMLDKLLTTFENTSHKNFDGLNVTLDCEFHSEVVIEKVFKLSYKTESEREVIDFRDIEIKRYYLLV